MDHLTFMASVSVLAPSQVAELLRSFAANTSLHEGAEVSPGRWRLSVTVERVEPTGEG